MTFYPAKEPNSVPLFGLSLSHLFLRNVCQCSPLRPAGRGETGFPSITHGGRAHPPLRNHQNNTVGRVNYKEPPTSAHSNFSFSITPKPGRQAPHGRGCSGECLESVRPFEAGPARAGVFRWKQAFFPARRAAPHERGCSEHASESADFFRGTRTRGGVPHSVRTDLSVSELDPQKRECSAPVMAGLAASRAGPAQAGVVRPGRVAGLRRSRWTRNAGVFRLYRPFNQQRRHRGTRTRGGAPRLVG